MKQPIDESVRARIRADLEHSYALAAGAGTGKTTLLVDRVLSAYAAGLEPERLVAITFTEAAAAELKQRIRAALVRAPGSELRGLADRVLDAPVETIHSFCARLLREFAPEGGWPGGFQVLQGQERQRLEREVFDDYLEEGVRAAQPEVTELLALGLKPARMLAVARQLARAPWTLENLAAREVVEASSEQRVRTLISELALLSRDVCDRADRGYRQICALELMASSERLAERFLVASIKATLGNKKHWDEAPSLARAKEVFAELKELQTEWNARRSDALCSRAARWFREFAVRYARARRTRGLATFEDLLHDVLCMLERDAALCGRVRERYRALYVDEFQDTDPVQARIFELIGGELTDSGGVFYVGDFKQSIYRFRAAEVESYRAACDALCEYPGGERAEIRQNFRSVAPILDWVNGVFDEVFADHGGAGELAAMRELVAPEEQGVHLVHPFQLEGAEEKIDEARLVGSVLQRIHSSGLRIADPGSGEERAVDWGDCAVLSRTYTAFPAIEGVLEELGIPYVLAGGRDFYQRQEVRYVVAALRAIECPGDEIAVLAALRSPLYGLSDRELADHHIAGGRFDPALRAPEDSPAPVRAALEDLWERHRTRQLRPVAGILEALLAERGQRAFAALRPSGARRLANLEKLIVLARRFDETRPRASFARFATHIEELERDARDESEGTVAEPDEPRVRLLTIHRAKGLEFPVVLLTHLGRGARVDRPAVLGRPLGDEGELSLGGGGGGVRIETLGYQTALDEEREREKQELARLLYVATTRARDSLWLLNPEPGGKTKNTLLEVVPAELWDETAGADDGARHHDARALLVPPARRATFRVARPARPGGEGIAWARELDAALANRSAELDRACPSAPPAAEARGDERARELGELVHSALERWTPGSEPDRLLGPDAPPAARDLLARALELPSVRAGLAHPDARREYPFVDAQGRAGRIDLLFPEGAGWVLVDYKSGAPQESDREQVRRYAGALGAVLGAVPVRTVLAYLGSGTEVAVDG